MVNSEFERLIELIFEALVRLMVRLTPFLRSRTGYANPRVRHITSFGYTLRLHQLFTPNIRAWLHHQAPIFPALLQVQTVNRCNAACQMCPYPYTVHREPYQLMSDKLWEKIALECAAEPSLHVLIPMEKNEPLLDPKLDARLAFFRRHAQAHQQLELVTNGALLTAARLARLVSSGLDLITISINAASSETYRKLTGGLDWERLKCNLRSIRLADTSQINIFVRFIQQQGNRSEERAFRQEGRRAGFNLYAFEVNNRAGSVRGYENFQLKPRSSAERMALFLKRFVSRLTFPVCPYAFSVAHILVNGDVPLCANDWQNRELLGNVNHHSIRNIFNSARAQEIRELMRQNRYDEITPCRDCTFRAYLGRARMCHSTSNPLNC